ncbi:MAG: imidazole glycerol phosphate synthase subunit HisH [Armatimonadota bacterium]|nr:imidazole glycerol phosphate synthase subunit HisH [Armatimonadota bacterium]MDW8144350.1 imidazole glycerol phosphate synthase subunit HisH [Armatimonadota bacterium]
MVTVIDYGVGNLRSVTKALEFIGCQVTLTSDPDKVSQASKLVLPGVGAFGAGMANLRQLGLVEAICDAVRRGVPLLGICLGLQLLFDESEEMGSHEGLKLVRGKVVRFPERGDICVPHMGWNALRINKPEPLFKGVPDGAMVYFVHSYFPVPDDTSVVAATTEHGVEFVSAISIDNIFGTQFHPEKSSKIGLQILRNFVEL